MKWIVDKSIKDASNLSIEPIDESKAEEVLVKIKSKFNLYYRYKNDLLTPDIIYTSNFLSIIDLVNEIFCEILIS
ncbi:MAG: hypothetical protein K2I67_01440, partial [Malacoplasma sp.]|nr:hypothetical protein [Malacoplasma sp.]